MKIKYILSFKINVKKITKICTLKYVYKIIYLKSVVSPTTKFHKAILVIEWKPRDVNFACTFEYTGWYIHTCTVVSDYHVGLICTIKFLVSTVVINK